MAVDSAGNVYCGAQFYSRVQRYAPDGTFQFGLHVDSGGGAFRIRVNESDELEVATARSDRFYRFSPSGQLLVQLDGAHHRYGEFGARGERRCTGPDGSTYRVRRALTFPSVVRTSPDGKASPVVSVPWHKWLLMGPLPAWLFCMVGTVILGCPSFVRRLAKLRARARVNAGP